mgnify:CR=1 FL=1
MGSYHPESPARLSAISDHMIAQGLDHYFAYYEAPLATFAQLLRVHSAAHLERLKRNAPTIGIAHLDPDTAMNPHTWQAALRAAGAGCLAVDLVMNKEVENAFCSVRPPGHHCEKANPMGFCFFNNVAVAAKYALQRHNLKRVAVIDFDVHHGNGTEDIVCGDDRILMVSFYQHPFYPEGTAREGANLLNVPVAAYTKGEAIREIVNNQWIPRLDEFKPEMIFISAGFDAHREDDMGQLGLVEADYEWITRRIKEVAMRHSQGRIVSCLEGGYNLSSLARSVEAHLRVLADV